MKKPSPEEAIVLIKEKLFKGADTESVEFELLKKTISSPFIYMIFEIAYDKGYSDCEKDRKTSV